MSKFQKKKEGKKEGRESHKIALKEKKEKDLTLSAYLILLSGTNLSS